MIPQRVEQYARELGEVVEWAQGIIDNLPLSISSPLKDRIFAGLLDEWERNRPFTASFSTLFNTASFMALNAMGWEDRNAPRPQTPEERMQQLLVQFSLAFNSLATYNSSTTQRAEA